MLLLQIKSINYLFHLTKFDEYPPSNDPNTIETCWREKKKKIVNSILQESTLELNTNSTGNSLSNASSGESVLQALTNGSISAKE